MAVVVTGETAFEEFRGDTFSRDLTFKDDNGNPIDITTWELYFTIKTNIDDTDEDAVIHKDIVTHIDPVNGKSRISFSATEAYSLDGSFQYDVQLVKPGGIVITLLSGKFKFKKDTTRRTST